MIGKSENLIIKLIGKDKFSKVFDTADKKMSKFQKRVDKIGKAGLLAGGAMAVGIGYKAVQAATDFEAGMTNVATIIDTTTENMDAMGDKVKEISKRVPVDVEDLTTALYNVRSAGINAADAMGVLETSAKLAVAGLSTTEEAVDLLTSAINVYGDESHDENKLADILFKTVKAGKTTVAELAQGFGKVAGIAKETGISIEE
jgi:TP901 family phage tail tape measure protein